MEKYDSEKLSRLSGGYRERLDLLLSELSVLESKSVLFQSSLLPLFALLEWTGICRFPAFSHFILRCCVCFFSQLNRCETTFSACFLFAYISKLSNEKIVNQVGWMIFTLFLQKRQYSYLLCRASTYLFHFRCQFHFKRSHLAN